MKKRSDQQEEGHGKKNGDTGDTESVGSETVVPEPPPRQATFLSSGFETQALMGGTPSSFTARRMPPEGHPPTNVAEQAEAEWRFIIVKVVDGMIR
jgi:hypothetical protein